MKNLILTLAIAAAFTFTVNAQNKADYPDTYIKKFQGNLYTAIKSDNTGLKKSGIYFAGKYEINGLTGVLVEELNKEKDPSVKVLIALALYRIGNEEAIDAIEKMAVNDSNKEVKRMCRAILEQVKEDKILAKENSVAKR